MMKRNALLLPVSAMQLFLLLPLAWWVRSHPVNQMDITITRRVQQFQSPLLTTLSRFLGVLCSWKLMVILTFPVAYLLWQARQRVEAVTIVSVSVLETVFRTGLQHLIARPRPSPALVHVTKEKNSPSFPSGHAATALSGWCWLLMISTQWLKKRPAWGNAAKGLIILIIALTGPSRVYLGEHWLTDVLGGYLYGGACFSLSLYLCSVLNEKES